MKRILSVLLFVSIIFTVFSSCGKTESETESTTKPTTSNVTLKISADNFSEDFSEIEFYETLDSIEGVFHTKNSDTNEYTIQLTEAAYKKLRDIKSKEVLSGFEEIINNTENYVTDIKYDEDFRDIKVTADREKLPEGSISLFDDTVLKVISYAMAYQIYTVEGQKVKIAVICSDNYEVVFESQFPIVVE